MEQTVNRLGMPGAATATSRRWAALVGVVAFAALTALAAQVRLPLPDTPVPITLQTLTVVLAGVTLGPRLGTLSMALYLLAGAVGYQVFASESGAFIGATFGYLLGFVLAQPVVGWLARPERRGATDLAAAGLIGHAVVLLCGVAWLAWWLGADLVTVLHKGLWPFLPGTIAKTGLAMAVGFELLRVRRRWFA